ncbi:MAG: hypothetical protein ABSA69_08255 [Verrucomicrobiota bacterium]
MAQKQESRSPDKHAKENLRAWQNFTAQAKSRLLASAPHQANAVTPRLEDMLARVEGIARWGLNE